MIKKTNVERLYGNAFNAAALGWGRAWERLTLDHQRALVAEEILGVLYAQDSDIPAERVRELMLDLIEMNRDTFDARIEAEGRR